MRRREIIAAVGGAAVAWPLTARAQQPRPMPRLGYLSINSAAAPGDSVAAFRQALRELGWVEGVNLAVEYRWADRRLERLPALAAELIALNVDVIAALEPPAAAAAAKATTAVPIVMRSTADPVEVGLIRSLARPGGNVTGVSSESTELHPKRLELLKELRPQLRRVAVFWTGEARARQSEAEALTLAARALGIELAWVEVPSMDELAAAFAAAGGGASGAILIRSPMFVLNRGRIAKLAAAHGVLAAYDERQFVEAGGLISYGASLSGLYRRAAHYVDRILRGAKPADLPVEQPTRFELLVNLGAARALGLTVPESILARADEVIE